MMMEYITLAGFILAVFGTGVAVGKIVEKIERLERKKGKRIVSGCSPEKTGILARDARHANIFQSRLIR